jgi:O-antigen ligase
MKVLVFSGLAVCVLVVSIFSLYLGFGALVLLLLSLLLGFNLSWTILAFVFLIPFDPQIEIRPGVFLYFDLFFLVPAAIYLWQVMFRKARVNWASFALVPYVLLTISTGYGRAENPYWFLAYSSRMVVAMLFMGTVAARGRAETITRVLGWTLIPQVAYGLYQLVVNERGYLYSLLYPHYVDYTWTERARAFFFTENNFGSYCAIVMIMVFALGLRTRSHGSRLLCYLMGLIGLVGLAATGSRGAWLGAIAGFVLVLIQNRRGVGLKLALGIAVVIVSVVVTVTSLQYTALQRSTDLDTFTVETRSTVWLAAVRLFLEHPFTGVGLTNYTELMPSAVDWSSTPAAAHNTYLQVLSEDGIIGFLLFFVPVFYLLRRNVKLAKESTAALLVSAGLVVFLVHGLFDFQLATAPQCLLLFAVLFGLASQTLREPPCAQGVIS